MLGQLEQLQTTVAELVAARDPARALATVADRAGYAVNARAFLLAGAPVRRRAQPGAQLRPDGAGGGALHARELRRWPRRAAWWPGSRPAQQDYGHLIAFGDDFFDTDRELLNAYANLAAVTLDTLSAVATAADRQRTAESLLALSSALTRARSRRRGRRRHREGRARHAVRRPGQRPAALRRRHHADRRPRGMGAASSPRSWRRSASIRVTPSISARCWNGRTFPSCTTGAPTTRSSGAYWTSSGWTPWWSWRSPCRTGATA